MNSKFNSLKNILSALVIGAALLLGTSGMAYAQDHHQRREWRNLMEHQRLERHYYGNSRALHEHQRRERRRLENHQRAERLDYYYRDRYYRNRFRY